MANNNWIEMVTNLVVFLVEEELVVYGRRVGDKNFHSGPKYWSLSYRDQYKLAEGMLREYFGFPTALDMDNPEYDEWFAESNTACNPFWVIAFLYGKDYARVVVNGEEPCNNDYYDEEEDRLLGVRTRLSA